LRESKWRRKWSKKSFRFGVQHSNKVRFEQNELFWFFWEIIGFAWIHRKILEIRRDHRVVVKWSWKCENAVLLIGC
jgi:uncharacterized protein YndB with AHSA1/START domain